MPRAEYIIFIVMWFFGECFPEEAYLKAMIVVFSMDLFTIFNYKSSAYI